MKMIFQKSERPGSAERHLLRRVDNPLFGQAKSELNDDTLVETQRVDHDDLLAFHAEFKEVLNETLNLQSNVESDVVLALKDRLERTYEHACRVGDDQAETKEAIKKLLMVIMGSIRQGAGNDMQAHQELDQEEQAREAHFALLDSSLVADLLNPETVIEADHLVPTLLSAEKDELATVLQIFDEAQLVLMLKEADDLIEALAAKGVAYESAIENLAFMQGYLGFLAQGKQQN